MLIRSWAEPQVGQIHWGRCWADPGQMLGRAWADTGQLLDRCWAGAGQMLGNSRADPVQMLGRNWADADRELGRGWTNPLGQMLGRSWAELGGQNLRRCLADPRQMLIRSRPSKITVKRGRGRAKRGRRPQEWHLPRICPAFGQIRLGRCWADPDAGQMTCRF